MQILFRAIVMGFGYKIGAELGRYVTQRIGLTPPKKDKDAEEDDEGRVPKDVEPPPKEDDPEKPS